MLNFPSHGSVFDAKAVQSYKKEAELQTFLIFLMVYLLFNYI